jgi:hypothetical protein
MPAPALPHASSLRPLCSGLALALVAAASILPGCTPLRCGPGTKQVQQADGSLRCELADQPAQSIRCDADAGLVEIIGGECVSRVQCDPATTVYDPATQTCKGTSVAPPTCSCGTPAAGKTCLSGALFDFVSNQAIARGSRTLRVAAFEPTGFLSNPAAAVPLGEQTTSDGCFVLDNLAVPPTGLIAVGVAEPTGTSPPTLALAGVGALVQGGRAYSIDAFILPLSVVTGWSAAAGTNLLSTGAYVALFSSTPVPEATTIRNESTGFTAGVTLRALNTPTLKSFYLGASRDVLDPLAVSTSALGAAVALPPPTIDFFTGQGGSCGGGACVWEKHPGASAPGVFFFDRFHDCTSTPMAGTCQ